MAEVKQFEFPKLKTHQQLLHCYVSIAVTVLAECLVSTSCFSGGGQLRHSGRS